MHQKSNEEPLLVAGTYCDPVPGYIDNISGSLGISYGIMTGFIRVIPFNKHTELNYVAADITVNSIFAIAMNAAEIEDDKKRIFNIVGEENCRFSMGNV